MLRRLDLDGDGRDEVLVATARMVMAFGQGGDGRWRALGRYASACDPGARDRIEPDFREGVATAPGALPDLVVGGRRMQMQPDTRCEKAD